ncbi:MAG: 50S ribosomal protein L3, partial [Candidatus Paceibacteria bacterium]
MDLRRPKRGSRGFRPRKRANSQVATMWWPKKSENRVLGFAGYKVGMTTVAYIDQSDSTTKGQEVVSGATVLEVPPIYVYGIRGYNADNVVGDMFVSDETRLKKVGIKKFKKTDLSEDRVDDVRLLVYTQPDK